MARSVLRGLLFLLAIPMIYGTSAFAQNFPTEVMEAANAVIAACNERDAQTVRRVISVDQAPDGSLVYVVDGAATPCGDEAMEICGTGGCQVNVYRYKDDSEKLLYSEQAWSWEFASGGSKVLLTTHPTFCGGIDKAKSCLVTIDVKSGKIRVKPTK